MNRYTRHPLHFPFLFLRNLFLENEGQQTAKQSKPAPLTLSTISTSPWLSPASADLKNASLCGRVKATRTPLSARAAATAVAIAASRPPPLFPFLSLAAASPAPLGPFNLVSTPPSETPPSLEVPPSSWACAAEWPLERLALVVTMLPLPFEWPAASSPAPSSRSSSSPSSMGVVFLWLSFLVFIFAFILSSPPPIPSLMPAAPFFLRGDGLKTDTTTPPPPSLWTALAEEGEPAALTAPPPFPPLALLAGGGPPLGLFGTSGTTIAADAAVGDSLGPSASAAAWDRKWRRMRTASASGRSGTCSIT